MRRATTLAHVFVEHIPAILADATLYVSLPFATVVHRCVCGCATEIVTPLTPTDWELTFDGETISLSPSIGNWHIPCQSHYWIDRSRVRWARAMSRGLIQAGREADRARKAAFYARVSDDSDSRVAQVARPITWPRRLLRLVSRRRRGPAAVDRTR